MTSLFLGREPTVADRTGEAVALSLAMANRHGLIAGATGTGKTVTLRGLAEGFSAAGVPVFAADIKGDLSGLALAGTPLGAFTRRAEAIGLEPYVQEPTPTVLWDLLGEKGHPLRTTVAEMGPMLMSRLLDLNDVQEGVMTVVFRVADEEGLALLDLDDLRAMLANVSERSATLRQTHGSVAPASVGAIQRQLMVLEDQGADRLFGEPAVDLADLMRVGPDGRGIVSLLAADSLMTMPKLYAGFLLWLLSELFEQLPEVGDTDKPKLVFFFDEAHLLFKGAPPLLIDRVTQLVRLIRSKGVGVYFVTQAPTDIPDPVLAQLGNRVQHALRAYTPKERKDIRAAAESFRPNPAFETADLIGTLGIGEALVSTLDDRGVPNIVHHTLIRPPASRLAPLSDAERLAVRAGSPSGARYDTPINRVSAHEVLAGRVEAATPATAPPSRPPPPPATAEAPRPRQQRSGSRSRQSMAEKVATSTLRAVGSQLGRSLSRSLVRGLMGTLTRR